MRRYPKTWSRELRVSLYMSDARAARLKADLERHTVKRAPLSWLGAPIAVGVIDIPIWQPQIFTQEQKREMTTAEKIAYLKQNRPVAVTDYSRGSDAPFNPRPTFINTAVNALFPSRVANDFSDDRVNTDADGETSESHRVGYASDLLNCAVSGEAGPGCSHGDIDHVQRAVDCLQGHMADEAQRKKNLADAGRMHSVRFTA